MSKLSICFCIRFHYKQDDPRFNWRFKHFVDNVLPRIKAQTYKDFDICVWCNDWHKELFEGLGLKTFNVIKESVRYKGDRKKYFHDFTPWSEVIGLDKYDIQLGLDSDDYIEPQYLEKIIEEIIKNKDGNKSIHICYEPEMVRLSTGKIEHLGNYNKKRGSAFMALYQPDKTNYRFVYEESHISIIRNADIAIVLPKGYCYAVAHEINESTGK